LDIDDGLSLRQALAQLRVLLLQFTDARVPRCRRLGLGSALVRRQRRQGAGLALAPPGGQVRGVQPLAAQQGADLAGLAAVGLLKDAQLVLGAEVTALRPLLDLRIGERIGGRLRRPCSRSGS